jgi:ankyrin repeat protein
VLEAHLSIISGSDRVNSVNEAEEATGRTALMFACYYNNLDAVELLAASDATL